MNTPRSNRPSLVAMLCMGVLLPCVLTGVAARWRAEEQETGAPGRADVVAPVEGDGLDDEVLRERLPRLRKTTRATSKPTFLEYTYRPLRVEQIVERAEEVMEKGFIVGDYPAFRVRPPVDWSADPHDDRSWRFRLNA